MFVPKIQLVALFGKEEDPSTWHEKPVVAVDDEGIPWVASHKRRKLTPATEFTDYRGLRAEHEHQAEIISAHEGWRAIFASDCVDDAGSHSVDLTVLPIAAWKREHGVCACLVPLVTHDVNYGISPGSSRGRTTIEDARDDGELLLAIFGPGEEIPSNARLLEVATEQLAERRAGRERERTTQAMRAAAKAAKEMAAS